MGNAATRYAQFTSGRTVGDSYRVNDVVVVDVLGCILWDVQLSSTCAGFPRVCINVEVRAHHKLLSLQQLGHRTGSYVDDIAVANKFLTGCLTHIGIFLIALTDTHGMTWERLDTNLVCESLADRDLCGVGIQNLHVASLNKVLEVQTVRLQRWATIFTLHF